MARADRRGDDGGTRAVGVPPLLDALNRRQRFTVTFLERGSVRALNDVYEAFDQPGKSKSQGSREFVAASSTLLEQLATRSLADVRLASIMLDGTPVGRRSVVWALGIGLDGTKVPLGIAEGAQENETVVSGLLENLAARGLDTRDVLWVIDGGKALRTTIERADKHAVIQRCVVHKARNVVIDHLLVKEREEIGDDVRERLRAAWAETHHDVAVERLEELARSLDDAQHPKAAESVREGIEMTLTLQRIGVEDPVVRRAVAHTNLIESTHDRVSRWKKRVKHWEPAPDAMRRRYVAAAVACAEPSWRKVAHPEALERLSLAVLASRHPDVALELANDREAGRLTVAGARLATGDERVATSALHDLRRWAERNGRQLELAAALSPPLRAAYEAESAAVPGPEREAGVRRSSAGDPLGELREVVDDALLVGIAERALAAAPEMTRSPREELEREADQLSAARDELASVAEDVRAWWSADGPAAARNVALARVRAVRGEGPRQDPLDAGRRLAMGEARAQWLTGESAYLGGLIEAADERILAEHERRAEGALSGLDGVVGRIDRASRAVAAERELGRRRQIERAQARGGYAAAEATFEGWASTAPAGDPLKRYGRALGPRREALLRDCAEAVAPQLEALDDAALQALRRELGAPWKALDPASAVRTRGLEERDRAGLQQERTRTLREQGRWQERARTFDGRARRAAAEERASVEQETARTQGQELQRIEQRLTVERRHDGSLDRFVVEHPEAALDHAVQVEIGRRQERELAVGEPREIPEPVPPEIAAGGLEI